MKESNDEIYVNEIYEIFVNDSFYFLDDGIENGIENGIYDHDFPYGNENDYET